LVPSDAPGGPLPDRESADPMVVDGEFAATIPEEAPTKRPSKSAPAASNAGIEFSA
jgi:hypothetical protein